MSWWKVRQVSKTAIEPAESADGHCTNLPNIILDVDKWSATIPRLVLGEVAQRSPADSAVRNTRIQVEID